MERQCPQCEELVQGKVMDPYIYYKCERCSWGLASRLEFEEYKRKLQEGGY